MSTLYGAKYEEEIDAIYNLVLQHLEKYGDEDLPEANERIFGAVIYGLSGYLRSKKTSAADNQS